MWTWVVPLVAAGAVFTFVLATTPPGFTSVPIVMISSGADAAAYAAGAAASLALLTLVALALVCFAAAGLLHRARA